MVEMTDSDGETDDELTARFSGGSRRQPLSDEEYREQMRKLDQMAGK